MYRHAIPLAVIMAAQSKVEGRALAHLFHSNEEGDEEPLLTPTPKAVLNGQAADIMAPKPGGVRPSRLVARMVAGCVDKTSTAVPVARGTLQHGGHAGSRSAKRAFGL